MRTPWPADFPPVFAHTAWEGAASNLADHPEYWPAKKKRSAASALRVCEDIGREEVLELIYDACHAGAMEPPPIVVAPALMPHESQNVLAIGHAKWLAHEMGWEVSQNIYQLKTLSRDFVTDGWFRLVHQPEFYGTVENGRRYVICDDVCTMGGTIASLRGFIESQGGRVICATVLASRDGSHARISLAAQTLSRLTIALGGELAANCRMELGHEVFCLTEPEGGFLLRCPSIDALRAGIHGARDG